MTKLTAWMDEEAKLYLIGQGEHGYDDGMLRAAPQDVFEAIEAHLAEVDDGEFLVPTMADIHRFEALWVFPEAIEKEVWAKDDFAVTVNREEDAMFADKGWLPVMTYDLVRA